MLHLSCTQCCRSVQPSFVNGTPYQNNMSCYTAITTQEWFEKHDKIRQAADLATELPSLSSIEHLLDTPEQGGSTEISFHNPGEGFFFFMWRQTGNHNINSGTCRQNLIPFEFYIWISAWLLKFLRWLSHEECSCLWWCHETWLHLLCWSDEYFKGCFCSFTVAGSLTLFPLDTPYIHMPLLLPRQQMLCHTNQLD